MLRERLEALLRSGHIPEVLELAAAQFGKSLTDDEAWWAIVCACRAAGSLKQWGRVIDWAEKRSGLKTPNPEAQGWIYFMCGTAFIYLGDPYQSEEYFRHFFTLADEGPHLKWLVPHALFNKALLLRYKRSYHEETRLFKEASAAFAEVGNSRQALLCRLECAWSHLVNGEYSLALPELQAIATELETADEVVRNDGRIAWALFDKQVGRFDHARALCQEALDSQELSSSQKADVYWILGLVAQATGDSTLCQEYAAKALNLILDDPWPPQMQRIEALRRRDRVN